MASINTLKAWFSCSFCHPIMLNTVWNDHVTNFNSYTWTVKKWLVAVFSWQLSFSGSPSTASVASPFLYPSLQYWTMLLLFFTAQLTFFNFSLQCLSLFHVYYLSNANISSSIFIKHLGTPGRASNHAQRNDPRDRYQEGSNEPQHRNHAKWSCEQHSLHRRWEMTIKNPCCISKPSEIWGGKKAWKQKTTGHFRMSWKVGHHNAKPYFSFTFQCVLLN